MRSLIRVPARQPVRQSFNVGGSFGGGVEKQEKNSPIYRYPYFLIRANKKVVCFAIMVAVLVPLATFAYTSPGKPSGFVSDFAGMLVPDKIEVLQAKLSAFEKSTENELAVVTVPDLGGDTVENFAVKLFEEWKIGKQGKDNGVLILIAQDSHDIKIEAGYGMEPVLTDAQSYWIIQKVIAPAFREGKFFAGIDGAADKIIAAVGGEVIPSLAAPASGPPVSINWFWLVFFLPLWLGSVLARSKSWWAGGIIGGVIGVVIGLLQGFLYTGVISIALLIPIGLLFDYVVSKNYNKFKSKNRIPPWWLGGGGFGRSGPSTGSGFGGFGGGSSGGGGASGRW